MKTEDIKKLLTPETDAWERTVDLGSPEKWRDAYHELLCARHSLEQRLAAAVSDLREVANYLSYAQHDDRSHHVLLPQIDETLAAIKEVACR